MNALVLNEGSGIVINRIWVQFNNIRTQKDHDKWADKVRSISFGSYGTIPFMDVLNKFDPQYPNSVLKHDFLNELQAALRTKQQ